MKYKISELEKIRNDSIASCRPEIAKRWDYDENVNVLGLFDDEPENVFYNSEKKYHFKCEYGHKFVSIIPKDIPYVLCPICGEKYIYMEDKYTSLRQATVYFYLKKIFPKAELNYLYCQHIWDIFIPELDLYIEYDSKEFHSSTSQNKKDRKLDAFAKKHGTLARIDAQYDGDFDNINKIAKKVSPGKYDLPDNTCRLLEDVYMTCDYLKYKFGIDGTLDIDWERDKPAIKELLNLMPGPIAENLEEVDGKDETELYKPLDKKELEIIEGLLNHEILGMELDMIGIRQKTNIEEKYKRLNVIKNAYDKIIRLKAQQI